MAEQQKEESQKTVVSFIVGLLIGGLLVWAFSGAPKNDPKADDKMDADKKEMTDSEKKSEEVTKAEDKKDAAPVAATLPVGDAKVTVGEQKAGTSVAIDAATFPTKEGWVGVRNMSDGKLGLLLGVARFSADQGLVPKQIELVTPTVAGREYAIVFYSESGDRKFNLAEDIQNGAEFATFTAK